MERSTAAYILPRRRPTVLGLDDVLARGRPLPEQVGSWRDFLSEGVCAQEAELFRQHERTGTFMLSEQFERPIKPGPKVKKKDS